MKNISGVEKTEVIHRLANSKAIEGAGIYPRLLEYLVKSHGLKKRPKACDIAMDVFGKDPSAKDYDEAVIRVYVRNLRQKLDQYYTREGKRDKIHLSIPKGGYGVEFVRISWKTRIIAKYFMRALSTIVLIIVLIIGILIGQRIEKPVDAGVLNVIWHSMVKSDLPLLMVLGNPFVYVERDTILERSRWIKDFKVLGKKEFNQLKADYPGRDLKVSEWPYYTDNVIFGLVEFLPFFEKTGLTFSIEERTDLTLEDLERQHILFVGGQHTLGFFKELLAKAPVSIDFEDGLTLFPQDGRRDSLHYKPDNRLDATSFEDVCLILKIPGPRQNVLMFVTSYHGTGTRAGSRLMTDAAGLACLKKDLQLTLGHVPDYFIAVFTVLGLGDLDYRSELLYAEAIDGTVPLWTPVPGGGPY
ncbi:helix-turn-helix domain-containing protein [bacterium]|nr:helix-turn-helix domain-containing protein [bacterium]